MNKQLTGNIIILVVMFAAMYFFLIRPQKKKEKTVQDMRNNLQVGDEIITIGGICGKIVKTKDDSVVIQVGADKVKFEITRWAVSTVVSSSKISGKHEKEEPKKAMPKKLKKAKDEEPEEVIPEDEK